ncbi:MAG: ice-binding family protein [Candidatus Eremiobacteraeota bacterium]|nr:ice-binding family protein [Candidatus Eremiobacteraeota bacterium]
MMKTLHFFQTRRLAALGTLVFLAGCSGGGCGNCNVPAFNPVAPTAPPNATPTPPGATPSPKPTPTPTPTPIPTPTPTPTPPVVSSSCSQGGASSITLGPALAPFALLAGSTITNVGNTLVTYAPGAVTGALNDDLIGVSPGTAVTGFYPPGTDTDGPNAIYAAGYNTNAAIPLAAESALTTAYNTAAGKPATATVAGDLSQASVPGYPTGTLPPGVYKSTSTLAIAAGNLTLDGGGNPQSVFIFQMGSTLTTTLNGGAGGNVLLKGNANACNIYWQVGSSATLGGQTFSGNVLAYSSITINATTFTGRALAGGPTLGNGTVSIPVVAGSLITNPGGQ